jgi:hypothetical protein
VGDPDVVLLREGLCGSLNVHLALIRRSRLV